MGLGVDLNPFHVPDADRSARMLELSGRPLDAPGVSHTSASLTLVQENTFFANLSGTRPQQQRVRLLPSLTAVSVSDAGFATMSTIAPPAGRGWEYLTGTGWDFDAEIAQLPSLLAEHVAAPSVEAGRYDLVVDPTNLWLTIHESIGHATELDRALGYEAAYAGTSFATVDQLGTLQYGSPVMNVTGDRVVEHGLASIGYDDEGVAAQRVDIIRDGVLVGYQLDRQMAALRGLERSNGCAYADSAGHIPMQRMPNVSLQPDPAGPPRPTDRPCRPRHLRGRRQVLVDRHAALQLPVHRAAVLQDRERSAGRSAEGRRLPGDHHRLLGIDGGGRWTADLPPGGALNCGKGQPGQVAPVSHGCPSALFRGVNILNTQAEGGQS